MAKLNVSLCFLVILSLSSFCLGKRWCVADEWASDETLHAFLDKACRRGHCKELAPWKPCYMPPTDRSHASYVLNLLYRKTAKCPPHLGILKTIDPSYGRCIYP